MRLIMGVIVVAMGVYVLKDTALGFLQIGAGALLIWRGVRDEIARRGRSNREADTRANCGQG